jgi:hypothetical protein
METLSKRLLGVAEKNPVRIADILAGIYTEHLSKGFTAAPVCLVGRRVGQASIKQSGAFLA